MRKIRICPTINRQFHIISQFPIDKNSNFKLIIFAADEIGVTPSSPCFANATPRPDTNKLTIKST